MNLRSTKPNYNEETEHTQYYTEAQYADDTWDSNEEPQKKKNKFVRPRPKRNTQSQKSTSFHRRPPVQRFEPIENSTSSTNVPAPIPNHSFNEDLLAAGLNAAGVTGMSSNIIQNAIGDQLHSVMSRAPGVLSLAYYKYYFRVDNEYVLKKLKRLLFPFLKMNVKEWKRQKINGISDDNTAPPPTIQSAGFASYSYQPPIYDINAPDGYLPLMAIVTYIVIMGFVVGTHSSSDGNNSITFSPQILIATGSSASVMLCIEVLLMKFAFYLIGSVATPPYWLDIVCYAGYKLVFATINLVINLIFDSLILYYVISITTGVFAGIFMIQTLRPYFRDLSEFASGPLMDVNNEPKKTRKIFLGAVGVAQILFIQFMGRYTSI